MPGPIDPNLLRRARATKGYLVAGVVVGSATAILTIGQAWLLSHSIADVFAGAPGALGTLPWIIGVVAAIFCVKGVLAWLNQWLGHRTSAAVKSQLRTDIMRARIARPVGSQTSTGGLVTLVTQGLDALDGYFARYLPQLLLAATVPVIVIIAILTGDILSAIIAAVTVPLIPVFMMLIGWTTQARTTRRWAVQTRLARHFADLVTGLPTLQVFGRAKAQAKGLAITEASHRRETNGTLRLSFLSALVLELVATLSVAVIAVTIGFRAVFGGIDLATALFILVLAPEVYIPVRQVGTHFHDSADGVAAARAAFALIDEGEGDAPVETPPSLVEPVETKPQTSLVEPVETNTDRAPSPTPSSPSEGRPCSHLGTVSLKSAALTSREPNPQPLLSSRHEQVSQRVRGDAPLLALRGLSHTYPGAAAPAVSSFSLNIREGEIVALAGTSGAGKTTILNTVMGFITPDSGDILVDGRRVRDMAAWRREVAFVGQFPGLVAGTVADNVRLGFPKATDVAIRAALDQAGAPDIALDQPIAMDAEGVSAGERRRIATARALLRVTLGRAKLMVLDEPTAGLDAASESVLLDTLHKLGVAALVVSHRPQVLNLADRVIHLVGHQAPSEPEAAELVSTSSVSTSSVSTSSTDEAGSGSASLVSTRSTSAEGSGSTSSVSTSSTDEALAPESRPRKRLIARLFDGLPGSRIRLVGAVLLASLATASSVALMAVSSWLLSFAATMPPVLYLEAPAVLVRTFGISRGVFRYAERLTSHSVALRLQSALRLETYAALARTTLLGTRRGDLLTRVIADVQAIQDLIVRVWIPFASASIVIVVTTGALAIFSPGSALVLLASAVAAGFVVPLLARGASHRADAASLPLRGELADIVHEVARTTSDLVAYGQAEAFLDRFQGVDARLRRGEARATWVRGVAEGFQVVASGVAVVGALWIGSNQVIAGTLSPVMLAVLVFTPLALHESLAALSQAAQSHTRARAALRRVEEVTDAPPVGSGDVPDRLTEDQPALHVKGLVAGWPGNPPVVDGLDLELAAGERVALTGPSGIGKTTVAATILGLIEARGGEIDVIGRPGYLAQDAHVFNTTIAENVRIGRKDATDDDITAALARAGLSTIDVHRIVGEEGSMLSGGEIRRVALARLLVGHYQVLILDEPTEHLDALTATALLDDIWASATGLPILAITHDPDLVARCDREVTLGGTRR